MDNNLIYSTRRVGRTERARQWAAVRLFFGVSLIIVVLLVLRSSS